MTGKRMTIYISEGDSWRGRSLYMSILETLKSNDIAGATVMRGLAGFGAHSHIRTSTIEVLSTQLPLIITVIDTSNNIDQALELVKPMVREGLITIEDIEIVKYTHRFLKPLPADLAVSEVMTTDITTISIETPVQEVVQLLLGQLFRALPVIDDTQHVVGIITTRDLLHKAQMPTRLSVGEKLDLDTFLSPITQHKRAGDIMSTPVHTVHHDDAIGQVVQQMLNKGLKRLPVVDDTNRIVGMLSRLDILYAASGSSTSGPEQAPAPRQGQTIAEIMATVVPTVYSYDDLVDVLQQILKSDINRVIVVDEGGRAVGIITEGDLVARVSPVIKRNVFQALAARMTGASIKRGRATAHQLMSPHLLTAPGHTTIAEAIQMMLAHKRKLLVVVDEEDRPLGFVGRQMLLAAAL